MSRPGFWWSCLISLLAGGILAGCGPTLRRAIPAPSAVEAERAVQQAHAFSTLMTQFDRLLGVSYRVLTTGVDICPDRQPFFNLVLHDAESYRKQLQPDWLSWVSGGTDMSRAAIEHYQLGSGVRVRYVQPGSQAASLLRPGDEILAIDHLTAREGAMALMAYLGRPNGDTPRTVTIRAARAGQEFDVRLTSVPACHYSVALQTDDVVNAYADGRKITVTTGMLRFATSDDELAIIIGHEIGHNAYAHIRKRVANTAIGYLVDTAANLSGINTFTLFMTIGSLMYSQEFESEADYTGLYLAARAGFDINQAVPFWRRMADANPDRIEARLWASHPASPERSAALQAAIAEIEGKKQKGYALLPGQ